MPELPRKATADFGALLESAGARYEGIKNKAQPTIYQDAAANAATLLGEPENTVKYVKIYRDNWVVKDKLDECVQWILSRPFKVEHPGKMFMSQHKRFITGYAKNQQ